MQLWIRYIGLLMLSVLMVGCLTLRERRAPRIQYVMEEDFASTAFEPISEYFTCEEGSVCDTVFRLDGGCRGGHYVMIGFDRDMSRLGGGVITLEYIRPSGNSVEEVSYELPSCGCSRWVYIGLTGECGVPVGELLTAWRVTVCTAAGEVISKQSYLWGCK